MSAPDPSMRVSDAEREAVIARLHNATEEGRLELHEFSQRSSDVYAARTYGDLQRLLADIPDAGGVLDVPDPASPPAPETPSELTLTPKASSVHRKGNWLVPRKITVKSWAGSVKLDFRHAVIGTKVVDIDVDLYAASIELILPEGAYVVDDVELMASSVKNKTPYSGGSEGLRVNVIGSAKASSVKSRREYRFLWWRW